MLEGEAVNDSSTAPPKSTPGFLLGGGDLGALMRAYPWDSTPLGPPALWPQSLKLAIRIMLTSRQPIWIGWGKDLTYFYNDPYKSIIGGKHPWALGRPTREVWREIWSEIGPMLDTALGGDQGTFVESQFLIMERNGYPEETYYTFSYSPIPNDDGSVGGIICANSDDTQRVIGERQLALLRDLAAEAGHARSWQEVCERTVAALAKNQRDLPFAMIYIAEPEGSAAKLAGASGIEPGHKAAPETIALDRLSVWPIAEVLRSQSARKVSNLRDLAGRGHTERPLVSIADPGGADSHFADGRHRSAPARLSSASTHVDCMMTITEASSASSQDRSPRRSPMFKPMRRSAGAQRRLPNSTAPRRRSSRTSVMNFARR